MSDNGSPEPIFYPGHWATETPDKPAVVHYDTGSTLTYAELDAMANRVSQYFAGLGLKRGDHVAFCLENRLEFLAITWGCHYAGMYYTAISSRLTAEEVTYILNDCNAQAFITSPLKADIATEIIPDVPNVKGWVSIGGPIDGYDDFAIVVGSQPNEPLADRKEASDMLYSSGTTGRPKGVKVPAPDVPLGTPPNLVTLVSVLFGGNQDAMYLSPAPMYHAAPMRFSMTIQRLGGTVVMLERFDPENALAAIETYHITTSQWVPTMFVRMLKLDEEVRARYDTSSLKVAIHAAAPCPIEVKEKMIEWWGPVLEEYYAGTEGNGFCYINSTDWLAHKGSVGKAITGEIRIVDEEGNEVPVGTEGGVYFANGSPFEYYNDPEKTASSRLDNGWTTLGDIGRLDEDGFLYLTDRKAYMIITGGVNVYPQEAENILTMHPKVYDVAVIGVPNEDFGEEVKAVVQPTDPIESEEDAKALEAELIAYCREHLADVKCPRTVDFRGELPRHPTGKLYKRLLKDEYWPATA